MNEYNERILKNVLQDYREEQDKELLREIEEAANNPLYQLREGEAEEFAKKYVNAGKKKKKGMVFIKAASILLVLVIGLSFIPINVEGHRSTIAELIANYVSSEFIAVGNEDVLLTYEGKYVPSWIPEGYRVESVKNLNSNQSIIFVNSDSNMIIYKEHPSGSKMKIDGENNINVQDIEINGYKGIFAEKDGMQRVVFATEDSILYISCDDPEIDLIGFAKKIEKR